MPITRRQTLGMLASLSSLPAWVSAASPTTTRMTVWKDPNCGCCQDWIALMAQSGFAVTVHDTGNAAVRAKLGLPQRLGSCHTAWVGGYLVEGHVPAADVKKLLTEKPKALGITVPGMPVGSPGMDGPAYGGRKEPFDVLLVHRDGRTRVFQTYP